MAGIHASSNIFCKVCMLVYIILTMLRYLIKFSLGQYY